MNYVSHYFIPSFVYLFIVVFRAILLIIYLIINVYTGKVERRKKKAAGLYEEIINGRIEHVNVRD